MTGTSIDDLDLPDDVEEFSRAAEEQNWSDGLPLVPPTAARVAEHLRYSTGAVESIGAIPPRNGDATLEKVAANAVMAGCRPEFFPIVVTAIQALLEPQFNLYGLQATTNPGGPLVLINGPLGRELDVNSAGNVFGQGWPANATIGRAVRLALINIGGGHPQITDRATHGFPGKFTMCGAENESASPFPTFHQDRGFDPDDTTVTVISVQGFHNIIDITSQNARDVMLSIAAGMSAWGTNDMTHGGEPSLVLSPEHAAIIAADGWSKADIRQFIYEHARFDLTLLAHEARVRMLSRRPVWVNERSLSLVDDPDDILVFVAGGPGIHALFLPSFGASKAVTKRVDLADGSPARSVADFLSSTA